MNQSNLAVTARGIISPEVQKSDLAYLRNNLDALKVRIERGQKLGFTYSEMSESFWCRWLNKSKGLAEVRNVCMCQLGLGDIIQVEKGDDYRYKFVEVKEKKVNVSFLGCPIAQDSRGNPMSPVRFEQAVEALDRGDIKAEVMSICPICGNATFCIQRPVSMPKADFRAFLEKSPLALTEVKNLQHSH